MGFKLYDGVLRIIFVSFSNPVEFVDAVSNFPFRYSRLA